MPDGFDPKKLEKALGNPNIPKIYTNNFDIALGTGDVVVILKNASNVVGVVNVSYTIAKTLSLKLQGLIRLLEKQTGKVIMTTEEINKSLQPGPGKDDTVQ